MMKNSDTDQNNDHLLISYKTLRRAIGYIGISLPIFLIVGAILVGNCDTIQSSISMYYHTIMRDGFVGIICAIAFFLFCYTGYDTRDMVTTRLAGIFALFVAFFPTEFNGKIQTCCHFVREIENPLVEYVHFIAATLFFITLAYMCIVLFTDSDKSVLEIERPKRNRNRMYIVCGYTMIACICFIALYFLLLVKRYPELENYHPVFWLESIALFAFGVAWLTKGETIFPDKTK